MAPLAVSTTSRLVTLMHRLVALELIVAAQAIDLRGGAEGIGVGPRVAYEFVRERVDVLTNETEWNVDIDGLTRQVADGDLARPCRGRGWGAPQALGARGPGDLTVAVGPIERAVDLLARVADEPGEATVAAIASDAAPTSTAYRLLAALERHGLVRRESDRSLALGTRVVALGRAAEARLRERLVVPAEPIMERLSREQGETVILSAPCGLEAIGLHTVEAEHAVRLTYAEYRRVPMQLGASGKILAAYLPRAR